MTDLTAKQSEFIHIADEYLKSIGGPRGAMRNDDSETPDTKNCVALRAVTLMRNPSSGSKFDDATCQHYIDILKSNN